MEKRRTKREIVKMLLRNNELDEKDEEELLNLLVDQPIAIDVDKQEEAKMSFGDHVADKVSEVAGSWTFIILFILFLIGWIILNTVILAEGKEIDPYPFILLNLVLSCIAAIQAPIIMMSQNRQAEKDSLRNQNDYRTDLKSELILEALHEHVNELIKNQKKIIKLLQEDDVNEKKISILVVILMVMICTGCVGGTVESAEGVKKCSRTGNIDNGTSKMEYELYYEGEYLTILHSMEKVTSDSKEVLDMYEDAYKEIFKAYEGLEYYENEVTRTDFSVINDTTINYAKIDIDKLLEIEGEEDNVIGKDGKVKLKTWLDFAKKFGVTCK